MERKERVKAERLEVSGKILNEDGNKIEAFKREFTSRPKCVEYMNSLQAGDRLLVDEKWSVDTLKKKLTDQELSEFRYKGLTIRRFFAE